MELEAPALELLRGHLTEVEADQAADHERLLVAHAVGAA